MENLNDFVKRGSNFVRKQDFEETGYVIAKYLGYKIYQKTYKGQVSDTVAYSLILQGEEKEKTLESGSMKLASIMSKVPVGTVIKIERSGEGFDTTWKVSRADATSFPEVNVKTLQEEFGGKEINTDDIPF